MTGRGHKLRLLPGGDLLARRAWKDAGIAFFLVALAALVPVVLGFDSLLIRNGVIFAAIYAILALGLNVVVGYVGLLDLGYVTFLATGAVVTFDLLLLVETPGGYVLPVATTEVVTGSQPFHFPGGYLVVILISGLFCSLLGLLRGIPTLKLTGDYYAIVTLGIAEIVYLFYLNTSWLTGGPTAMKLSLFSRPSLFGAKLYDDTWLFYYLVMGALGVTVLVMDRLNRSRVGRAWAAIRLDETAAQACGIDIARHKMLAFAVSGFFGGVGGSLFAVWSGTVAVKSLEIWQSILILCAVVLGGMGSIRGVLLGSAILFPLREVLREELNVFGLLRLKIPPEASYFVYGLLLVFIMRFRPQGLLPRGRGESVPMSPEEEGAIRSQGTRLFDLGHSREAPHG